MKCCFQVGEIIIKNDELFLKELEKDYILISADEVIRKYKLISPPEIDIILRDEYGSTRTLNMKLDEEEFEKMMVDAEKNNCLFGIWRKSVFNIGL